MKTNQLETHTLKDVNRHLREAVKDGPITLTSVEDIHGIAAGLKQGDITIDGNAGDYTGVLNAGATIHITQNTGKYAADNMTKGTIIIDGDADYGAAQYCYGGNVIIYGNAGDFTGTMNKGALILIQGDVGHEVATYMLKGDLIVVGNAGHNFANYLIRGSVYIGGEYESLGHNAKIVPMTDEDHARLRAYFETYAIQADPAKFKKIIAASEKPFYH